MDQERNPFLIWNPFLKKLRRASTLLLVWYVMQRAGYVGKATTASLILECSVILPWARQERSSVQGQLIPGRIPIGQRLRQGCGGPTSLLPTSMLGRSNHWLLSWTILAGKSEANLPEFLSLFFYREVKNSPVRQKWLVILTWRDEKDGLGLSSWRASSNSANVNRGTSPLSFGLVIFLTVTKCPRKTA